MFDPADVRGRTRGVDAAGSLQRLGPQLALIAISGETHAIDVACRAADRGIRCKDLAQDHYVVVVAERGFGAMQRRDIAIDPCAPALEEPQRVPQRFYRLAPFVEVNGSLAPLRPPQRLASVFVCSSDAWGNCREAARVRAPLLRGLPKAAKIAIQLLQAIRPQAGLHGRPLLGREASAQPRERMLAEQPRRARPQLLERFEHRVGIAQRRQHLIDGLKSLPRVSKVAVVVRFDYLQDRTRLLDALPRFMNPLIGGTARATQLLARVA